MVRPQSATALLLRMTREEESVHPSVMGRNSNVETRKRLIPDQPREPSRPRRCLLLAVILSLSVSRVVCALNLCCKILSFSPLGQDISAGERMQVRALCTPWPRGTSSQNRSSFSKIRAPASQNPWKALPPSHAGPAPASVHHHPHRRDLRSQVSVGQTGFSSRTSFVLIQNTLCVMG